MINHRTAAELKNALDAIVAELRALDTAAIMSGELVPLVKTVQDIGAYAGTLDAQIRLRVLTDKTPVPGVAVKPGITHRKWNDEDAAARVAYEQFGKAAFDCSLKSPAGIEKLGAEGKAFAAFASTKPAAEDRVVY